MYTFAIYIFFANGKLEDGKQRMRLFRLTISVNPVCLLVSMAATRSVCLPIFLISGNLGYSEDSESYTPLCV